MQIILQYLDTNKEINSSIAAKLDILKSAGRTKNKVYFKE